MSEALSPFNELAACPKCGFGSVAARHANDDQGERIKRTCERCGYSWPERCLDDQDAGGAS